MFSPEQLQTFSAVLAEGTFDAAARVLHITPSAVSQRIRALEHAAGRVLLQRSNPVAATESGAVVLRLARQCGQLMADAGRELGLDGPSGGPLSIPLAVNADSLAVWFLQALAGVPESLGLTFELHRDDEQHSTGLLRSGTVMAAVTASPEPVQGCSVRSLGAMRYRAVAAPGFVDRWRDDGGTLAWLGRAPAVDYDRKDSYQHRFLHDAGVGAGMGAGMGAGIAAVGAAAEPGAAAAAASGAGPRHFIPSSREYADAVRWGLGWGLLPQLQCAADLAAGRLVELDPARPMDVPLYWQRWRIRSAALDAVTEAVVGTAAAILDG
jgi:LysR family transcriptional regulator (chromosome initiation inhibitor)